MTDEDHKAAEELALEMKAYDAMKFLRNEIGYGLRDARQHVLDLAYRNPDTVLGRDTETLNFLK